MLVDHSFIVQSFEPLKMVAPSGAKEQDVTMPLCPVSACCSWKVDESWSIRIERRPTRMSLPLGENEQQYEHPPKCWMCKSSPVLAFHSFHVLSLEPLRMCALSGETSTHLAQSLCPTSVLTRLPDATSHTFRVQSFEALTMLFPPKKNGIPRRH